MKKLLQITLASIIFASSIFSAQAEDVVPAKLEVPHFSDVGIEHPNYWSVQYMKDLNLINGYEDGTFGPNKAINRAELMTIVANMAVGDVSEIEKLGNKSYRNCFPDVGTEWFAKAVCYAKEQGWVSGFKDGTFKPANQTNRAEATKIILNAYHRGEIPSLTRTQEHFLKAATDIKESDWFYDLTKYARGANLYDMHHADYNADQSYTFKPLDSISRKEVAEMIARVISEDGAVMSAYEGMLSTTFWYKTPQIINGRQGETYITVNLEMSNGKLTGTYLATFANNNNALYIDDGTLTATYTENSREVEGVWEGTRDNSGSFKFTYDPIGRLLNWQTTYTEKDMLFNMPEFMQLYRANEK